MLKLAEWIRSTLPEVQDEHLFRIELDIRRKIELKNLCMISLMGDNHDMDHEHHVVHHQAAEHDQDVAEVDDDDESRSGNGKEPGFSAQVRPKCIRCVKV